MHSQQPPGVVQNWSALQCSEKNTEQCGYDHAPVTRGRMRAQYPLPHGPPSASVTPFLPLLPSALPPVHMKPLWVLLALAAPCSAQFRRAADLWLPMPNGLLYHSDCIHQYDTDFHVEADTGRVVFADGHSVLHTACSHRPRPAPVNDAAAMRAGYTGPDLNRDAALAADASRGINADPDRATPGLGRYYSGWSLYAGHTHPAAIGALSSVWRVPAKPKSAGPAPPLVASSVYIFNGLEDGTGHGGNATLVLQPVLQYGCVPSSCGFDGSGGPPCGVHPWLNRVSTSPGFNLPVA